jgi:hypothetical protein
MIDNTQHPHVDGLIDNSFGNHAFFRY